MKKNKINFTVCRRLKLKPFFLLPLLLAFWLSFSSPVKAHSASIATLRDSELSPGSPSGQ